MNLLKQLRGKTKDGTDDDGISMLPVSTNMNRVDATKDPTASIQSINRTLDNSRGAANSLENSIFEEDGGTLDPAPSLTAQRKQMEHTLTVILILVLSLIVIVAIMLYFLLF
jgi:hypothetical protein